MPRPDVRDERIPQIIAAAAQVFSEHGIDGASMTQVAQASGVSKATVYHYFTGKDELVLALVRQLFDSDVPAVQKLLVGDGPFLDRLMRYVQDLADLLDQQRSIGPVLEEARARSWRFPEIRKLVQDYFGSYIDAFAQVLIRGIESGDLRPELDPREAAQAVVSLIEGSILTYGLGSGSTELAAVLKLHLGIMFRGMAV